MLSTGGNGWVRPRVGLVELCLRCNRGRLVGGCAPTYPIPPSLLVLLCYMLHNCEVRLVGMVWYG